MPPLPAFLSNLTAQQPAAPNPYALAGSPAQYLQPRQPQGAITTPQIPVITGQSGTVASDAQLCCTGAVRGRGNFCSSRVSRICTCLAWGAEQDAPQLTSRVCRCLSLLLCFDGASSMASPLAGVPLGAPPVSVPLPSDRLHPHLLSNTRHTPQQQYQQGHYVPPANTYTAPPQQQPRHAGASTSSAMPQRTTYQQQPQVGSALPHSWAGRCLPKPVPCCLQHSARFLSSLRTLKGLIQDNVLQLVILRNFQL